jgi:predicted TPR repeat methyltransferase
MGCGTGLAGQLLRQVGYQHIDGIDLSPEMLDKARTLEIYKALLEGDLSTDLDIPRIYQGVICVGVFSHKPDQPDQAAKLLDYLLPDGLLVTTVNGKGWHDLGWDKLLEDSRRRHGFSIESVEDIPYLAKQGIGGKLLVLKP